MKSLTITVLALTAGLLLFGAGCGVREYQDQPPQGCDPSVGHTQIDIVVPVKPRENRFRYRGMLLDIQTGSDGKTEISIGPQHAYRMGYLDGYHSYSPNPKYFDRYQYKRGYEEGRREAREERWP